MKLPGYRLGAPLGQSAHGALFRAVRELDERPVVVKTLSREYPSPSEVRRLEFEYRMLEKVRGTGVVDALGLTRTGGRLALILEDFGAKSLDQLALPLSLADFFKVARQLALAIGHVHGRDVIHKDIKPHNILVDDDFSRVKLIDFQLASEISRERQDVSVANQLEGSLCYISPEQTGRMNRALDYRSDYYSLGVTFYELLVGEVPFAASDVMGWVHCHISKVPPSVRARARHVPEMLSRLVAKLMDKEPRERYQSARGLLADLTRCEALLSETGSPRRAPTHSDGLPGTGQRVLDREGGSGELFSLGSDDLSERFAVSQRLVGRDAEVQTLTRVLDAACKGPSQLLLVSGYSGVGKSSLIREVYRPLASHRGYFIAGKFDPLDRSVPYAALVEALRQMVGQLLTEPDDELRRWRTRIQSALGAGASVMAELVPELTGIIGPQPSPTPLDPTGAHNRFKLVFSQLIGALACAEHPLVLFIDDLQWADASTPELIVDLFTGHELQHLLVIGSYRDNEVTGAHLLMLALEKLRAAVPSRVTELRVLPLDKDAVSQMVASALHCSTGDAAPLAREIFEKAEGNPFFTNELLATLYREGAITFSATEGRWNFSLEAARQLTASQNVVELLLHRLERMPPEVLRALQMAACIGNVFSLSTLASLIELTPDRAAALLRLPVSEGLLIPLDDTYKLMQLDPNETSPHAALEVRYRFQHDRVQQAAYSLIADADKAATHASIGRRLLAAERSAEQPEDIFSITNHLNLGRSVMTRVNERESLARLNRKAGAKALAATAFSVAAKYHEAGVSALTSDEWAERPELRFALFSERVGSLLMAGERDRAAVLCEDLFGLAPTLAARGAVYLMKSQVMLYQGRMVEAIAAAREGLGLLGIEYPEDPAAIEQAIGAGIGKMMGHLARVPIEHLAELPELTDAEKIVALQLLFFVVAPAIMVYPPLFVLAELLTLDLALTHGTTAVCAKNFVDCGMIVGSALGDYGAAYRLGKVAFRVVERYDARALAGQVHFVFAAYVSPWGAPYAESLHSFEEARRLCIETGDHQHLAFSEALHLRQLVHLGRHLDECDAASSAVLGLLERIQAKVQVDAVRLCRRFIDQLLGREPLDESWGEGSLAHDIVASGNAQYAFQHGQIQMLLNALLGEWEAARGWSEFTRARSMAASTLLIVPEYQLLECLVICRHRLPLASTEARPALLAEVRRMVDQLKSWTEGCPENFAHKYHLASAELARVEGAPTEVVMDAYEQAITSARAQFLHLRALATELYGRYVLELGRARAGEPLLREARQLYADWGAVAKVQRLDAELEPRFARLARFPQAAERRPSTAQAAALAGTSSREALELSSVLKASRAISGEVKSERVFSALMNAILENAAAQHGCLVLCGDDDQLHVRARADQGMAERDVAVDHPLAEEQRVCRQIVRYVARTHEALVVDDARSHAIFGTDPYVVEHGVKSVLCMPILNQGRLVAVLYLENGATTHAFPEERAETLRLIAGQAAVSITNASLYEALERKVEERTRELAAKTRQIAAMLDGIEQGVFTLDGELRVQPEYSRHLEQLIGREQLVGLELDEVLFAGSDLDAAVLAANSMALRFSIGAPLAIARVNAEHLIKSYTRRGPGGDLRHYEVDWSWIIGEEGVVDQVLVAARDVTVLRGLKQAAAEAARETEILTQILDAGVEDFKSFSETSRRLLAQHAAAATRGLDGESRRALFRDVHTIKGHSQSLGLDQVVAAAHAAEGAWAAEASPTSPMPAQAIAALRALDEAIAEYERTGERKLGRLWAGADARFKQALGAIESVLSQTPERASYPARALTQVKQVVHRLNAVPLDQVLRETARVFPSLARELGKSVPEIEWVDDGTLLDAEWGRVMKDALVHTFRNSLDHGIETREEREAVGKAPRGKIALFTVRDEKGISIHLRDDGRGLPIAELRTKTGQIDSPDHAVAEAIFDYGLSTARQLSHVSGRGIGMDAVRGFLRERGGDVAIAFTGDTRSGYRPFELIFRLPDGATVAP